MRRPAGISDDPPIDTVVARYLHELLRRLRKPLDGTLHGAYLGGSLALGDYVPGRSDIDVLAICAEPVTVPIKREVVGSLSHPALSCPTRGLELVLYARTSVATPARGPGYEINLNTGPGMEDHVSFDPSADPPHWFILDLAIAREHAVRLAGPPAAEVFTPIPRNLILGSLVASLDWHLEHEPLGHNTVLNACRAWRFAEERRWDSKASVGAWARRRWEDTSVVDAALASRRGAAGASLDGDDVRRLVLHVRARLEGIRRSSR